MDSINWLFESISNFYCYSFCIFELVTIFGVKLDEKLRVKIFHLKMLRWVKKFMFSLERFLHSSLDILEKLLVRSLVSLFLVYGSRALVNVKEFYVLGQILVLVIEIIISGGTPEFYGGGFLQEFISVRIVAAWSEDRHRLVGLCRFIHKTEFREFQLDLTLHLLDIFRYVILVILPPVLVCGVKHSRRWLLFEVLVKYPVYQFRLILLADELFSLFAEFI